MGPLLSKQVTFLSRPNPIADNPYQRLLYEACEKEGARLLWTKGAPERALLFRPSGHAVLHVHWVWLKTGRAARLLRYLRFRMQLWIARCRGWTVLVTLHNLETHDGSGLDRRVDLDLRRAADGFIAHDTAGRRALEAQLQSPRPIAVIPHPS